MCLRAACASILALGTAAQAATPKEQELEARISQLEQMVKELSARTTSTATAVNDHGAASVSRRCARPPAPSVHDRRRR